ncbi:MAG TPA: hypothetical protein VEB64_03795, partial [Azospirillaceae bacterium]|nr:hypothetical protein [Azospirillaceae bacterium]
RFGAFGVVVSSSPCPWGRLWGEKVAKFWLSFAAMQQTRAVQQEESARIVPRFFGGIVTLSPRLRLFYHFRLECDGNHGV